MFKLIENLELSIIHLKNALQVFHITESPEQCATALFSIFYYQQRQEGKNRPEALQQAQI
ncbi:MAG: hypothetical protein RMZ69_09005 [Nostoc sp. ChiQUE01a]|nr:hypothetical protein [Nostoc sp. ChiQUE01a]